MEKILRRLVITFIMCIIILGTIFFIINYNSEQSNKKIIEENEKYEDANKNKNKNKTEKETVEAETVDSTTSDEKSDNITSSSEKQENYSTQNESSSSNTGSDYSYKESDNQVISNYIPITKFSVKIQNNRLYIGDTTQLTTTIYPTTATEQEISYQSSNKNIAIVSQKGVVTAVNTGECYITITVKNVGSGKLKVTVLSKNNTIYTNQEINCNENSSQTNEVEYNTFETETTDNSSSDDTSTQQSSSNISTDSSDLIANSNSDVQDSVSNNTASQQENNSTDKTITSKNNTASSQSTTKQKVKEKKNGWYKINGKKYYYKNNKLVKDAYIDYIYLNSKGVAQEKIGNFSATLYGATAWVNQNLNMRQKATINSSTILTIPTGGKMKILSNENSKTKYIKVSYGNKVGYVYSDYIYVNLPDIMPDIIYNITNANKSIFKSANQKIPNVTGKNLYGYTKKYNAKIGKSTYYAPLLYPIAKQLQKAYNLAKKDGYNLKIYDTYRPYDVTKEISNQFKQLYNSNTSVKNAVNYDKDGIYWGASWFLASNISRHNSGTALDLTLTNKNGEELSAQTTMHTLDARSVIKYNNSTAKKLSNIMTSAGFETLKSEWWHFQEDSYKNMPANSFKIK